MGQFRGWLLFSVFLVITAVSCQQSSTADAPVETPVPTIETLLLTEEPNEQLPAPTVMIIPTVTAVPIAESPTQVAATTTPVTSYSTPHVQVVFDFLNALQNGMTAAESGQYLGRDLQAAVADGRPLPTIIGVQDAIPNFDLIDLTDNSLISGAIVRAYFNFDSPTFAVFRLVEEDGEWRIKNIAQHNLIRTAITRDLLEAEFAIINFYQALADNQLDAALTLLTDDAQTTFTADALSPLATGMRRVTVTTLQPVRATDEQINFYVRLFVTPNGTQSEPWRNGDNPRWLTLVRTDAEWQIDQIIDSQTLAGVKTWQRVHILPINMTLDIPGDWARSGLDWSWSPDSFGLPGLGVRWADLGNVVNDDVLLALNRKPLSQQPINLGWARGTQYDFQLIDSSGENPIQAETHIIVRTDRRAYDFYAAAETIEGLEDMRPLLQRMVAAVVIHDPDATAYRSIEVTTDFLATLIRDRSGASSIPYLSNELLNGDTDYQSLLQLLGVDTIFRSFNVTWLENTEDGQANVLVTLQLADDLMQQRLFTLQPDEAGDWHIIKIEAVSG